MKNKKHKACVIACFDSLNKIMCLNKIVNDLCAEQYEVHVYSSVNKSNISLQKNVVFHDISNTEQLEETLIGEKFRVIIHDKNYINVAKSVIEDGKFRILLEKYDYKQIPPIPNKILFIRYGAIKDVVHTTAAFRAIKQLYPDTIIHYLTSDVASVML